LRRCPRLNSSSQVGIIMIKSDAQRTQCH
jgi:hypothetical protein